jgi:hypothetical protein
MLQYLQGITKQKFSQVVNKQKPFQVNTATSIYFQRESDYD